ncbi:tRNA modification GTPase [Flavobacterium sp.]|uniref:tRNA modification GTPase n=1 Tax=Flavobacterium sp. TaxID=239 RepID=UPI002B4B5076|nr:tRNA modification GTPase [Flavobacterium sp.]HLP62992.1 hypothetical protein [Flavobacterium sp.]
MRRLITFLSLLVFTISYSQINFEKGYYIKNSGEKVECYIKNIGWLNNPVGFLYKSNVEDSTFSEESITNIKEFGIYDVCKYIKAKVDIDYSSKNINQLTINKNPVWTNETLFLKVLIEGDVNLYLYNKGEVIRYFFKTSKTDSINQLVYHKYLNEEDNTIIEFNSLYKNQLYSTLTCDAMTLSDFENLQYKKASLSKVIEKHNKCSGISYTNYENASNQKEKVFLKFNTGLNFASLDIVDPNQFLNLSTEIKNEFIFKVGLEAEYILPFNNNKWSVFLNPSYHKFKAEKNFVNNDGLGIHSEDVNHTVNVDYSIVEIPVGFRYYSYLNSKSRIFYNIAYVFKIDFGSSTISYDNASTVLNLNSRNNFALGIGYCFDKWNIEYRLNTPGEVIGGYISWSGKYSTNGLVIGYTIF